MINHITITFLNKIMNKHHRATFLAFPELKIELNENG